MTANPVFCALDTTDRAIAGSLAKKLSGLVGGIKIGLEFFTANGPDGIKAFADLGMPIFLDLKLHDIPNTVAGAMKAVVSLGVSLTTIHAQGGIEMMRVAKQSSLEASARTGIKAPAILAVTVLTSLNSQDLKDQFIASEPVDLVRRLTGMAQKAGLDGVVCSAHEVAVLRAQSDSNFLLVVPGIRPSWSGNDDQKRVMTPAEAMAAGASCLVIGRPITAAADPTIAAARIQSELS